MTGRTIRLLFWPVVTRKTARRTGELETTMRARGSVARRAGHRRVARVPKRRVELPCGRASGLDRGPLSGDFAKKRREKRGRVARPRGRVAGRPEYRPHAADRPVLIDVLV